MKKTIGLPALIMLFYCAAQGAEPSGYPRVMTFRENFPDLLPKYGHLQMLVSDLHVDKRKFSDVEFKKQHPDALMLVQFNNEPAGIWGTWEMPPKQRLEDAGWLEPKNYKSNPLLGIFKYDIYPLMDFPGHWVYEAGTVTRSAIPADEQAVTVKVADITPFLPVKHRLSLNVAKQFPDVTNALLKDVVIYSRTTDGAPDWLNADLGSLVQINEKEKTITIRRWKNAKVWSSFPDGAYIAPSAVPVTYENANVVRAFPAALQEQMKEMKVMKPFMPNLTKKCPVDPRTGLTAVETMAKKYAEMKPKVYPNADGFVFDVSCGTFWPSHRVSDRTDCDNDGRIDNFQFDGVLIWPLGIFDFCSLLRDGKPGVFDGLGKDFLLISDSNFNEDQRFFDVMNGGEYEHSFTLFFPPYNFMYSSNLDRFLLWNRIGRKPDITYVHNKYADETKHGGNVNDLRRPATLAHYRLDMATACMGSGYVGKMVLRAEGNPESVKYPGLAEEVKQYGGTLPTFYDEYDLGRGAFGWLGQPKGPAMRLKDRWSDPVYAFDQTAKLPKVQSIRKPWEISNPVRTGDGFAFEVKEAGLWRELKDSFKATVALPLPGVQFEKNGEYVVTFRLKGSSVYDAYGPQYRNIPKNLRLRLAMDDKTESPKAQSTENLNVNVAQLLGGGESGGGYMQEVLVFQDEREVTITLIAAASGSGALEFDVTDEKGTYEISALQIRKGCADVLAREFDNGLVLLNGSSFSATQIEVPALFPEARFRRISGKQEPVHNNGELAKIITLAQGDGIFLERIKD